MAASMNGKPVVSCIIIFLNDGKYLAESIDSVLAQTFDNWELFLVDDGSTDESSAIARAYAGKHSEKIYYLEHADHQNLGKNTSRNLGIAHARGAYIALLDGDDVWLPEKLAEQFALMELMPEAGMVYGRTQFWCSWAGSEGEDNSDSFYDLGVEPNTLVQPPELFMQLLEGWAQSPTTCSAFIRKTVIDEIGNFDEAFHDVHEDLAFFAKIELTYPVFVADNLWARYRQHPESSFAQHSEARTQDRTLFYSAMLDFLKWIENYLHEQEFKDAEVWKFLANRQKSAKRNLQLIQKPIVGRLALTALHILEWSLGAASQLGRLILPARLRNWLWLRIGKKIYTNL